MPISFVVTRHLFWILALALAVPAFPQQPDVQDILKKVGESYTRAAQASQFDVALTARTKTSGGEVIDTLRIAMNGDKKTRVEQSTTIDGFSAGALMIADGETFWTYHAMVNQYSRRPLNEVRDQARNMASMVTVFVEPRESQLSYLRSEAIEVGGKVVDCYVVQTRRVPTAVSAILWIDKLRLVIVRSDSTSQFENGEAVSSTTIFHTTKLTEPIPDDVFTFTPPPGAELVNRLQ